MTRLAQFFWVLLLFSCGGNSSEKSESGNILEDLTFTVDTVVVNPGDKIINLSYGLGVSALSLDRKYLYQLDPINMHINAINLDQLVLDQQYPFEEEGPNGIGPLIFEMQIMDNEELYLCGYDSYGLYTLQGEKVKTFNLNEIEGIEGLDNFTLGPRIKLSRNGKFMFSMPRDRVENTIELAVIDLETKSGKLLKIPAMEKALDYNLEFRMGNTTQFYGDVISISLIEDLVFISNSANNKVYNYDYVKDSLYLFDFDFALVPNEKDKPIKKEVSSIEEFRIEEQIALGQIYFGNLLYDSGNNRFFRFGRILGPKVGESQTREGEYFLFVFDKELKLIGEAKLEGLKNIPSSAFFKDGKLWSYVNVEDELGFAVMDFKF
jgi:hypothetical protein